MKTSNAGIKLIKDFEGCVLSAYRDFAGYYTIGYGHLLGKNKTEYANLAITQEQAENYLKNDIIRAEAEVDKFADKYPFTQNQYDALVSFAFNIGSIRTLTQDGLRPIPEIARNILFYVCAGGVIVNGLVKRRRAEYELFTKKLFFDNGDQKEFLYKVTIPNLCVRTGPGTSYNIVKKNGKNYHTGKGVFTITEVIDGFGCLKSGAGWISLNGKYGYRLK